MPAYSAWPHCSPKVVVAFAALLTSLSCAPPSWSPGSHPAPGALTPDTRLQVWRGGQAVTLREVTQDADSIRGRLVVPLGGFSRARVAIARCDIDSVRQQPQDKDNWFGAGVGLGVVGAVVFPYLLRLIGPKGT